MKIAFGKGLARSRQQFVRTKSTAHSLDSLARCSSLTQITDQTLHALLFVVAMPPFPPSSSTFSPKSQYSREYTVPGISNTGRSDVLFPA